jgi:hypothetical protein
VYVYGLIAQSCRGSRIAGGEGHPGTNNGQEGLEGDRVVVRRQAACVYER